MESAYASLQEFFRRAAGALDQLPGPQHKAIDIIFGREDGIAPDGMLVGLALLNVLSEMSAERPVLWVVDDAQWLDSSSAQVIGFAARHLSKDAVAFVFAACRLTDEIRGVPEPAVGGLGSRTRRQLATVLPDRLDDRVVDRAYFGGTDGVPSTLFPKVSLQHSSRADLVSQSPPPWPGRLRRAIDADLRNLPADA